MAINPHFDIPFRLSNGRAVVVEQDAEVEIMNCVETVLRYEIGTRPEKPEFGIPDQAFLFPDPGTAFILSALDEWEPRADDVDITQEWITDLQKNIKVEGGEV